ncbi:MAG TPA: tetratricopeptide repeat protein [Pirellulales bacterium]|nr:tetratricopeptide repeat protein [Pirellulales bacterium]
MRAKRLVTLLALVGVAGWTLLTPTRSSAQDAKKSTDPANRQYAAAAALQNRDQYELAADEWTTFLATFPKNERADRAQHYLGICRLKAKQYPQALEAFNKVVADYPKFELLPSTLLHLGLTQFNLARTGQKELYAKAEATFANLVAKYPQDKGTAQARYYWAESLYEQGKKGEAAKLYGEFAQKYPKDPLLADVLYALGVAQEELGQSVAAGATYDTFLKQFGKQPLAAEVGMRRGETLFAQGQFAAAEKWFVAAAAKKGFAQADWATLRQAACLSELRKYDEAAVVYASLPERFPGSQYQAAAQLAHGRCAFLAGKFPAARAALAKVQAAGGAEAVEAAHWLARSWLKEGQPAEALKVIEAALPKADGTPHAVQLAFDRADALYEIPERRRESAPLYAALAQQHPQDPLAAEALYMAAFASMTTGDYQAALAHADGFLKQYADKDLAADVLNVAAESNLQLKKYAEAGQLYETLLKQHARRADAPVWKVRRGLILFLEKKYAETVASLEPALPALKSKESLAEALYLIGSSQNELKQYAAAAKSLAASLAAAPAGRQADEALLALAFAYRQTNDMAAAKTQLNQLIKQFPESHLLDRVHYRLAEDAFTAGEFATAAAEYHMVEEKYPTSALAPRAAYGLGWTQISQKDPTAAVLTLDALLAKYATSDVVPRARYARAVAREQIKQFAPAIEDLQAFLKTQPTGAEFSDARFVLGLCQAALNQHSEAVSTFRSILGDDPKYAGADRALYELAWSLKSLDQAGEAAETFARLPKEHPNSPLAAECLYLVGEHQYQQGEFKPAAVSYYAAMRKAGKSELGEKAAHKLGWAYFRQRAFDKAQQSFAYQRASFPQGSLAADAAFMEAESLFKRGQWAESLAAYAGVKNPGGKDFAVLALLHAGQAEAKLKHWEQGLALLARGAKEHPDSEYLPELLYEQAWARQNLGQLDAALPLYEEVTAKTDNEVAARARFMVGEIYFEKKNHAEAIKNFFKAAYGYGFPEWQANSHYEAGRCFEVLGKKDQAKKSYQEVVEKFPKSDKMKLAKERLEALAK